MSEGQLALLIVAAFAVFWALFFARYSRFKSLVDYADLDMLGFHQCKNVQDVQEILAKALAQKAYLLCHRAITLVDRLQASQAVSPDDADAVRRVFEHYRNKGRLNPYRQDEDVPDGSIPAEPAFIAPELFDDWGTLVKELELHREFVRLYNELFGIPKNVI